MRWPFLLSILLLAGVPRASALKPTATFHRVATAAAEDHPTQQLQGQARPEAKTRKISSVTSASAQPAAAWPWEHGPFDYLRNWRATASGLYGQLDDGPFGSLGGAISAAIGHLQGIFRTALAFADNASQALSSGAHQTPQRLGTFWSSVAKSNDSQSASVSVRPDPIGISIGFAAVAFAGYSIYASRREADRIMRLFEANTQIKELAAKAARGEKLPSAVVVRGTINADGNDVYPVTPGIQGLQERVGLIEQPKNAWIEITRQAQRDPQLRGIADAVVEQTGAEADYVPDISEPVDPYARAATPRLEGPLVLSEILVARICAKHQSTAEDKTTRKVTIKRPCRNESYNCFHGRREAEGLHIVDMSGSRADLVLPPADAVGLTGIPEPPPLFLPVDDVWTELTHNLRKDGFRGADGKHQRLDDLPPMRLSDPYTLRSKFIFIDIQSQGDLGNTPENSSILRDIGEAYRSGSGPARFLWEPRGFYDSVKDGGYDDVPPYAPAQTRRTEMVTAGELTERAQAAAQENSRNTPYCEPTFTRLELDQRRDQENCFRYTELGIPRGIPVTVLARPMIAEAGTGEGAECQIRLVPPLTSDEAREANEPKADRFRFRILKGHTVEDLLRHRDLNVTAYYGLAVVGAGFAGWAAAGYPGMSG